jgi:hypothetical protein
MRRRDTWVQWVFITATMMLTGLQAFAISRQSVLESTLLNPEYQTAALTRAHDEAYTVAFAEQYGITVELAAQLLRLDRYPLQYDGAPGIPDLQTLTQGANDDAEALQRVTDYYDAHEQELAALFEESHPERLKALYTMHIVHISHVYGVRLAPPSLLTYLSAENSHCGMYSRYQAQILDAFGMTWRIFMHNAAEHAWIEVLIDGQWETFDATVNVWISIGGFELVEGKARTYRLFYTPMNDLARPDARAHFLVGYNMPRLRLWMPELGLTYSPFASSAQLLVGASVPGAGSTYNMPWYRWHDTEPAA